MINFPRLYSKLIAAWHTLKGHGRASFSQVGEDRILDYYFSVSGVKKPTYLDIGANHPVIGSNSFYFYLRGSHGVCVEPDPDLYRKFKRRRTRDIVLNTGIGISEVREADFYIFPVSGWNTFSKEEAAFRKANGQPFTKIIKVSLKNINDIISEYFTTAPDFVSIDVEGLDFEIVKSLDFERYAPGVMLLETIRFGNSAKEVKQQELIDYVIAKGYRVYADTYVNTIFVKKEK